MIIKTGGPQRFWWFIMILLITTSCGNDGDEPGDPFGITGNLIPADLVLFEADVSGRSFLTNYANSSVVWSKSTTVDLIVDGGNGETLNIMIDGDEIGTYPVSLDVVTGGDYFPPTGTPTTAGGELNGVEISITYNDGSTLRGTFELTVYNRNDPTGPSTEVLIRNGVFEIRALE